MSFIGTETGEVLDAEIVATSGLTLSVEQWATRIRAHMIGAVESVLAVGNDLAAAKRVLGHGKFGALVVELGMGERTAQRLMQIAANPALANPSHVSALPPAYSTLAELARLDADVLERAIQAGDISPDMERKDAADVVARYTPKKPKNATEGPGADGSVSDGDATTGGDGADSHDIGRPEPEPGPAQPGPEGEPDTSPSGPPTVSFTAIVKGNGGRLVELILDKGQPSPAKGARLLCTVLEGES